MQPYLLVRAAVPGLLAVDLRPALLADAKVKTLFLPGQPCWLSFFPLQSGFETVTRLWDGRCLSASERKTARPALRDGDGLLSVSADGGRLSEKEETQFPTDEPTAARVGAYARSRPPEQGQPLNPWRVRLWPQGTELLLDAAGASGMVRCEEAAPPPLAKAFFTLLRRWPNRLAQALTADFAKDARNMGVLQLFSENEPCFSLPDCAQLPPLSFAAALSERAGTDVTRMQPFLFAFVPDNDGTPKLARIRPL